MPKSAPRRLKPNFSMTLQEAIEAMHETFAVAPEAAQVFKRIADRRGVSFEFKMYETIALAYHGEGLPMPPELREYLAQHATEIHPQLRAKLLKPLAN
jgi:hypothetical protein